MDTPQTLPLLGGCAQNGVAPSGPRWPLGISSCATVEDKSLSPKHPAGISIGWWALCPQGSSPGSSTSELWPERA